MRCTRRAADAADRCAAEPQGQPVAGPDAGGAGLRFEVGGHALDYLAPNVVDSPLAAHLAGDRPAPYSICFRTAGEAKRLDPADTEGVQIALV